MRNILFAFAAGVALTSMTFVLIAEAPISVLPDGSMNNVPFSQAMHEPISEGEPLGEKTLEDAGGPASSVSATSSDGSGLPEDLAIHAGSGLTTLERRSLLSVWSDEDLQALVERAEELTEPSLEMQQARYVRDLASAELRDRERVERWIEEGPPEVPIELPPEFGYLSEMVDHNHELIQRDPIDPNWAPQMEDQLTNFFASRPEITATFGYPIINCRTVACEMAFVSYGIDAAEPLWRIEQDFRAAIEEFYEQPWASQLSRTFPGPQIQDGGAVTFLWYPSRVDGQD